MQVGNNVSKVVVSRNGPYVIAHVDKRKRENDFFVGWLQSFKNDHGPRFSRNL